MVEERAKRLLRQRGRRAMKEPPANCFPGIDLAADQVMSIARMPPMTLSVTVGCPPEENVG
jgi:hypothetical protein